MQNWAKPLSFCLSICLTFWPLTGSANDFAAQIRQADLIKQDAGFVVRAEIDYRLSPTAKEALQKGIPLTWRIVIEIRRVDRLWDSTLYHVERPYRLQYHALLNQYEVITPDKQSEMFLTLNVALGYLSNMYNASPFQANSKFFETGHHYKLAIKCLFDRESLPVPLRPFAYLDKQWYLSSDWYVWPIQK